MLPATYSAWRIRASPPQSRSSLAAIDNLYLAEVIPTPTPSPGTALVNIKAAALNARDMSVVAHDPIYPIATAPDLTPCADGAGVVVALGEGSIWKVGDKVLLRPTVWIEGDDPPTLEGLGELGAGAMDGTLREYAVFVCLPLSAADLQVDVKQNDARLNRAPSHLSFTEMAPLAAQGGTASNALFFGPQPFRKGMTILTQGTGGVSAFAIQLASAAGATVIATSSSDARLDVARNLGATHGINYRTHPNWADEALRLTSGRGVDHVLDIGGAGTIEHSIKATRHGGLISLIGYLTENKAVDIVLPLLFGAKTLRAVFQTRGDMIDEMVRIVEERQMRPPVSSVHQWKDAKAAFIELVSKEGVGKIVIEVGDR